MKKIYIVPETNIYKVNVVSHLMEPSSFETREDTADGDLDLSREANTDNTENTNNRGNVWDNIW